MSMVTKSYVGLRCEVGGRGRDRCRRARAEKCRQCRRCASSELGVHFAPPLGCPALRVMRKVKGPVQPVTPVRPSARSARHGPLDDGLNPQFDEELGEGWVTFLSVDQAAVASDLTLKLLIKGFKEGNSLVAYVCGRAGTGKTAVLLNVGLHLFNSGTPLSFRCSPAMVRIHSRSHACPNQATAVRQSRGGRGSACQRSPFRIRGRATIDEAARDGAIGIVFASILCHGARRRSPDLLLHYLSRTWIPPEGVLAAIWNARSDGDGHDHRHRPSDPACPGGPYSRRHGPKSLREHLHCVQRLTACLSVSVL